MPWNKPPGGSRWFSEFPTGKGPQKGGNVAQEGERLPCTEEPRVRVPYLHEFGLGSRLTGVGLPFQWATGRLGSTLTSEKLRGDQSLRNTGEATKGLPGDAQASGPRKKGPWPTNCRKSPRGTRLFQGPKGKPGE